MVALDIIAVRRFNLRQDVVHNEIRPPFPAAVSGALGCLFVHHVLLGKVETYYSPLRIRRMFAAQAAGPIESRDMQGSLQI